MKKLLFWILLISGTALILGSCAKKEESDDAAATETTGTGSTASGTISGIENLTGTFNLSFNGEEPSGGCISNSTAIAAFLQNSLIPSDSLGFKLQVIITSSTTWTKSTQYYSDASCATLTGYFNSGYKNASVGDSLSGLSAGSSPVKPTTAKKISYNSDFTALKSNTDTTTSHFNTLFGASTLSTLGFTQGTELNVDDTDEAQELNIWETGTVSGSSKTYLFFGDAHSTNYPSDWTSADVWWQE